MKFIPLRKPWQPFITVVLALLAGCNYPPNNTLNINTAMARLVHTGGSVIAPLGSQPVAGQWQSDVTTGSVAPFGTTYSFQGVTAPSTQYNYVADILGLWPTSYSVSGVRMPAVWNIEWEHPNNCLDTVNPPYPPIPNPFVATITANPVDNAVGPFLPLYCFTNTPLNEDFVPTNVYPQFALDDQIPSTIQVAAFTPIQAANSITNLRVFATNLTNPANVSALTVASDGSSALFPYPTQSNGASLPAGAYVTTITTDPAVGPQTTNGFEPFYIGHDDTNWPGAYGLAIASPGLTTVRTTAQTTHGGCVAPHTTTTTVGGTPVVLVTLLTQGSLAVGNSANTIAVGSSPTTVIPFNNQTVRINSNTNTCNPVTQTYTGAQSALVVNTGSNNVSIVNIGQYNYPSGFVAVGRMPVAATINPSGTMAYIANYMDSTVSEVNLSTLQQTRVIAVMPNPASLTFDTNGNLWVGGQGAIMNINVSNWSIATTSSLNGLVTAMSYDVSTGLLLETVAQNGSTSAPNRFGTSTQPISYMRTPQASYTTQSSYSVATGQTTSSNFLGDNSAYAASPMASYLAFPGQLAFAPPIYTATNGDISVTVTGAAFTVYVVSTNQILIQGTLPYPARSVALTPTMVYFTMPESNSLVSLPIIPQ